MPVPAGTADAPLTITEFLARDWPGEWRHELVDGVVVAMNPPLAPHARMVTRVAVALETRLLPGCGVFTGGGTIRPDDDYNYRVPDLTMACRNSREHWVEEPRLVVEILSRSTQKADMTGKLAFYRSLPSIDEILLVRHDQRWCELWQRVGENWLIKDYIGTSELPLRITTSYIPLDEIYEPLEL